MNSSTTKSGAISVSNFPQVGIRAAAKDDIELLREWKNANRDSFFYRQKISKIQQEAWFIAYLQKKNDFMFVAELNEKIRFGCLGARYTNDKEWDIYNVINGSEATQGKGYMSVALQKLISFCHATTHAKISLKVLNTNPAQHWYKKNGFVVTRSDHFYLRMEYCGSCPEFI